MISLKRAITTTLHKKRFKEAGQVSLTEAMVAGVATTLIVASTAAALQSTGQMIGRSGGKATLRQNTINGLRLMRSEVERSLHLIVSNTGGFPEAKQHLNIDAPRYQATLIQCSNLAGTRIFKPLFAAKMVELSKPVVYGLSTNTNGFGYSIQRCGPPLNLDGTFNETEELFLSSILDDIASLPCSTNESDTCPEEIPTENILANIDFTFSQGLTPTRQVQEPALRIETDSNFKLVKFVDPTSEGDAVQESYLEIRSNLGSITKTNVYFTAFARTDKRIVGDDESQVGGILSGAFFQNITSSNVRFALDGSGSMSACVMWGDGYGSERTFYDPEKQRYQSTRRVCSLTRMEALISEMTMILSALPDSTKVGITSFSSDGYTNHKPWDQSKTSLIRLGDEGQRDAAIDFVNTLDDGEVTIWGGTDPWEVLSSSFDDSETDTLYFLTDGEPNKDPQGGKWKKNDYTKTAELYASKNEGRSHEGRNQPLVVNTTSIGLQSDWLAQLSALTNGSYNQVDQESVERSNNGHGNNQGFCDPSNPSANFDYCNGDDDIELSGQTP